MLSKPPKLDSSLPSNSVSEDLLLSTALLRDLPPPPSKVKTDLFLSKQPSTTLLVEVKEVLTYLKFDFFSHAINHLVKS